MAFQFFLFQEVLIFNSRFKVMEGIMNESVIACTYNIFGKYHFVFSKTVVPFVLTFLF